ncbi:hypothetical protein M409DRAFT_20416 [Zasmidium cellare ATCC 36951]|uniref:ASST-domain-containing protein n=1 Tax=Zasmidium cellare ATCC 36951 TaxID=1080233 RepID=A0A6A6CR76_ZASCE|nr:uncharacterized protein M409DRAFT_20416 [Zasmidium cellare ATCC 36951]KAF2169193.1 hypothetical protein M409DRAFT_20416 [Zasmidium cellare ATCC 36951]
MNILLLFLWHLALCLHAVASEQQPDPQPRRPPPVNEAANNGTYGYYPTYSFKTEVDLTAPITNFMQWNERCNDGSLYFLTPRGWGIPDPGPMILDEQGNLIWTKHFANKFGGQAYDFMVQKYKGEEYLTFWLGDDRVRGHGSGFYYMLNSSYDIVHRVGAADGLSADLHEFLITDQGTALMTMYEVKEFDIKDFPDFPDDEEHAGPSYIWDCVFQEIDIETGDLVFGWRASDHVDISATYRGIGPGGSKRDPYDWFHINSIEKDELGNYLTSSRYTHSITYVDGKTGDVIWTLGGKMNNFMDLSEGDATNFAWQHDARFLPTDTFPNLYSPPEERPGYTTRLLTLFDNAAEDQHYEWGLDYSRGLLLEVTYPNERVQSIQPSKRNLDLHERGDMDLIATKIQEINGTNPDYTVRVIKVYINPDRVHSSSQGSMQVLPQGHGQDPKVFVGYGLNPVWTEFDADGSVLCDVHYGAETSYERGDIQSYRTYKFKWVGLPDRRPAVDISDDDAEVYVSWNGATEVDEWIVQCSNTHTTEERAWEDAIRVKKNGFETSITLADELGTSRYLRVIALDKNGLRLEHGITTIIDRGVMATYMPIFSGKVSDVTHVSGLKMLLILVCTVCTVFVLFEGYRRFLVWRTGKPSAGPLRWRKGATYRLISEA